MRYFLLALSYLFHPLLIPFAGTLAYFAISPKFNPIELPGGHLLPIFILTVIIPAISYLILKNLGAVHSVFLSGIRERYYPLLIHMALLLMVVLKVLPANFTIELHFYFLGLIVASGACFLLLFMKIKSSLHLTGMGSLLMFLIGLSIHFEINITLAISLCTLATGLAATARLYLKSHSRSELVLGLILGLLSQLLLLRYWL